MKKLKSTTPEGFSYRYYSCPACKEEIVDMKQLHSVEENYRKHKQYHAKLTKWGQSIGLRIPKELSQKYNLDDNNEVLLVQEKDGIKIVVS